METGILSILDKGTVLCLHKACTNHTKIISNGNSKDTDFDLQYSSEEVVMGVVTLCNFNQLSSDFNGADCIELNSKSYICIPLEYLRGMTDVTNDVTNLVEYSELYNTKCKKYNTAMANYKLSVIKQNSGYFASSYPIIIASIIVSGISFPISACLKKGDSVIKAYAGTGLM